MIDFPIQRCTRRCAASDRPFEPGEAFYSLLRDVDGEIERLDFAEAAWRKREASPDEKNDEKIVGWWRSRVADPGAAKQKLAPSDVLLGLLDQLGDQPEKTDTRYVLALLLVRRRILRLADEAPAPGMLVVECPSRDEVYELVAPTLDAARAAEIQAELNELIFTDG